MSWSDHSPLQRNRTIPLWCPLLSPLSRQTKVTSHEYADVKALLAGGGAPEIELARALSKYSRTQSSKETIYMQSFADALEVIPSSLTENARLNRIKIVTELRHYHEMGEKTAGVNVGRAL
jgi:chaperonin GroEL (HSP60 family)